MKHVIDNTDGYAVDLFELDVNDDGSLTLSCTEPYDKEPATFTQTIPTDLALRIALEIIAAHLPDTQRASD